MSLRGRAALNALKQERHDRWPGVVVYGDEGCVEREFKSASKQKPDKPIAISLIPTLKADGIVPEELSQTGLTLGKFEEILVEEYGPLNPWVSNKLRLDYGVRDLPVPGFVRKLQIVAPIAEELVHDTIVELWEKKKENKVELNDKGHVRGWLKGALKIALRRWAQQEAREYEGRVYSAPMEGEEQDPMGPEVIEPWDAQNKGTLWRKIEEEFDRADGDCPSAHFDQKSIPTDDVKAALKCLPNDILKLVNQVYRENVSWKEASASRNIESRILEREVQQWLHSLRPQIPSYQPSRQSVREDTRRARKSFHCPVCETHGKPEEGALRCGLQWVWDRNP